REGAQLSRRAITGVGNSEACPGSSLRIAISGWAQSTDAAADVPSIKVIRPGGVRPVRRQRMKESVRVTSSKLSGGPLFQAAEPVITQGKRLSVSASKESKSIGL